MFRDIAKKSAIYSLVPVINRGASFLLLPIYTRVLTPADYGVMELLDLTSNIIGLLLGTRIGQALFYFYFTAKDEEEQHSCLTSIYMGAGLVAALAAFLIISAAPISNLIFGSSNYALYLRLVFASFGVSVLGELNLCYLRAIGQAARYVKVTFATLAINVTTSLILVLALRRGIEGLLVAGLLSSSITTIWLAWTILSGIRLRVDWRLIGRMFRYSIPLSVSSLAIFLIHYGDRLFLRSQVSLSQLGIYGLAYKFAMLVPNCHLPFALHWNAQVRAILDKPDGETVYIRICTYLTAGMLAVGVALALFIRPVLAVMAGQRFFDAAPLVPALVAAYVIRAVGAHIQGIFTARGTPGLEARVSLVGGGVCMVSYAVLIPMFKVWGAVAATLIGFTTILVYGFYCAQRLRRFDFEYARLLRTALMGCVSVGVFYAFRPQSLRLEPIVAAGCFTGYLAWIFCGCLDSAERAELLAVAKQVLNKLDLRRPAETPA